MPEQQYEQERVRVESTTLAPETLLSLSGSTEINQNVSSVNLRLKRRQTITKDQVSFLEHCSGS